MGRPQRRALLALLLAGAGQTVSMEGLIDGLWSQDPPESAANVIHRHVGAVRRLLEPGLPTRAAGRWLLRGAGGYRLAVDADSLDLLRFSGARSGCRGSGCRAARRPGPRCTGVCWPGGSSSSCWTTPWTPGRCVRCCPGRPAAWRSSLAAPR
ncbi:winged helix-turn-helix domain-containing protein [Streptomyces sparsogenes]|uniref:AfsR/SARP family transcriptional regulator n=1 Tax=Streptomyces sparsogenes TaxID=67365 RepID=UPI0033C0A0C8